MSIRGYITPDTGDLTGTAVFRHMSIPSAMYPYVYGALARLTDLSNWEQVGTATIEETTQFFEQLMIDFPASVPLDACMYNPINYSQILSYSYVFGDVTGYIPVASLPEEARGASCVFVEITFTNSGTSEITLMLSANGESNEHVGRYRTVMRPSEKYQNMNIAPLGSEGIQYSLVRGATGITSYNIAMGVVGWL